MAEGKQAGRSTSRAIVTAERRQKVAMLRKAGATQQAIADALGVSKATVCRDLEHLLEQLTIGPAQELVAWELAMINDAQKAIWQKVQQGHLGAGENFRKLSESRRKLLGLDAPTKVDLGVPDVDLNAAVTEIMASVRKA